MNHHSLILSNDLTELPLPHRPQDSHKGTFGRVLIVAGSRDMAGAAYLSAKAAYRMGAGLCRILTVRENLPILATLLPEALLSGYDKEDPDLDVIAGAEEWADVLVIGCGMGTTPAAKRILSFLLRRTQKPLVLDADALNILARSPALLSHVKNAVLTPHSMEMARLLGITAEEVETDRLGALTSLARKADAVCVLKGHRTLITERGKPVYQNETGNSALATAGSGDVLAGLVGGLLATSQEEAPDRLRWARLGVCLHGLCGEEAASELTEYSVMACDLIDALPRVLRRITTKE